MAHAIDLLRRRRHSRTALHFNAARNHARIGLRRRFANKLLAGYKTLAIGNPLDRKTVMGPPHRQECSRYGAAFDPAV